MTMPLVYTTTTSWFFFFELIGFSLSSTTLYRGNRAQSIAEVQDYIFVRASCVFFCARNASDTERLVLNPSSKFCLEMSFEVHTPGNVKDFPSMEGRPSEKCSKLWPNLPMPWVFNYVTSRCCLCQNRTVCKEGNILELKMVHQVRCLKVNLGQLLFETNTCLTIDIRKCGFAGCPLSNPIWTIRYTCTGKPLPNGLKTVELESLFKVAKLYRNMMGFKHYCYVFFVRLDTSE
jgi:hypothetical protein